MNGFKTFLFLFFTALAACGDTTESEDRHVDTTAVGTDAPMSTEPEIGTDTLGKPGVMTDGTGRDTLAN